MCSKDGIGEAWLGHQNSGLFENAKITIKATEV
jgi:hypothetical protein